MPHRIQRLLVALSAIALLASLLGSAAAIHQHSGQTFGAVSGLPDPALDPRPLGLAVNVALEQYADLDPVLESLPGFRWLRQTFSWNEIEPTRGEYDWVKWDAIVSAAKAHDKEIIAVLNFSPAWAVGSQSPNHLHSGEASASPEHVTQSPNPPTDFAAFASAFAARYADSIDVYQIWDEPNISLGWGGQPPSAASYAALLQAAYAAIHAADPHATVLAAALAPNVETGPDNLSDLLYLQQLYDLGAGAYFDAAAGKPYGFYTGPDDRLADPAVLNFSRFALLRQVMVRNGDGRKLLWGGNFGWNTLDSPWGKVTPVQQVQYTLAAYQRAQDEWPWAGPLALESYQPSAGVPSDDPPWGFALAGPSGQPGPLLQRLSSTSNSNAYATPGNHPAQSPTARYFGDWEFSDLGADIPENYAGARIEITFRGTDLALKVRRSDYRGYLYVAVDGRPANLLPRDGRGAYLVLTAPQLMPEVVTLPVASGLAPDQPHMAVIHPERGWDQWAFVGFSVGRRLSDRDFKLALGLLAAVAFTSAAGVLILGGRLNWGKASTATRAAWERLGATGQLLLTALVGGLLYLSAWLTFGDELIRISRRSGDALPIALTALTAGLLYFSPPFLIGLLALAVLFTLFYLRLDLAFAFIVLFIPFYLKPPLLWQRGFSLVEITTVLAFGAWALRNFRPLLLSLKANVRSPGSRQLPTSDFRLPTSLDLAMLALLLVSALSLLTTDLKALALREFRVVIFEPVLFYFLLRFTPLDRAALWRIVDFFMIGAVMVAAIGLYQYFTGANLITAEGGLMRLRSVYGSPNNVALFLGRALPIAAAVGVMGWKTSPASQAPSGPALLPLLGRRRGWEVRPALYALAAPILGLTILLTFSKGALLLGLPVALAVVLVGWLGRRGLMAVGATAAASLAALPLLSRLPRFADLFNLSGGTSFFRIRLWISAWRMFLDHPLLGVGLDNFLYQYRGKYILPEAWQEPNLSHPHNIVLDYLSRLGLLGFACGLWLQVGFWQAAVSVYRRLRAPLSSPGGVPEGRAGDEGQHRDLLALCVGLMASMAGLLAHGLVDNSFFLVDLAFVFCLTLALMQHLHNFARPEVTNISSK